MRSAQSPPTPADELANQVAGPSRPGISRLLRRIHMYTGLFLSPWMLMYALSTLVMTHREFVGSFYATKAPVLVTERTLDYSRSFPVGSDREQIAEEVLNDIGLAGTHVVSGGKDGKPLVIQRQHPVRPRRITWDASRGQLVIAREEFRTPSFLERMHRRRGYSRHALENAWGLSVDIAVIAMMFWGLSGIWLWWELKPTRRWGILALTLGLGVFAALLALI